MEAIKFDNNSNINDIMEEIRKIEVKMQVIRDVLREGNKPIWQKRLREEEKGKYEIIISDEELPKPSCPDYRTDFGLLRGHYISESAEMEYETTRVELEIDQDLDNCNEKELKELLQGYEELMIYLYKKAIEKTKETGGKGLEFYEESLKTLEEDRERNDGDDEGR